jgi:hypothetical protein
MNRIARRAVVAASIVLGMLVAAAVAGLPLYVFPPAAALDRADLVYVIGPPTPPRMALAEELASEGVADELLVSVSAPASTTFTANDVVVCTAADTTCETPDPFTTKGEARLLTQFDPLPVSGEGGCCRVRLSGDAAVSAAGASARPRGSRSPAATTERGRSTRRP